MEHNTSQEKLKTINPTTRELELEIPAERVKQEYEKVLKEYVARVKLPGFRKGYAPREMVQRLFDAEIKEAVLDNLIPDTLRETLNSLQVVPVNVPTVKDVNFTDEGGVQCLVSFEVWPSFELPADYLEKKVEAPRAEVEESEVEAVLNRLRENTAEYLPVADRGVQDGDYVVIEIQGRETASKKLLPAEKVVVLAGHPDNEPRLNEVLPGMKPGEEKIFTVQYPEDFRQKRFAGKEIEYRLKVLEIKEKKLPDLNDDFARLVDEEVEGLEALREKIRQDLLKHKEQEAMDLALDKYLENLAAEINLVLPESLVREEARAIIASRFRVEQLKNMPAELLANLEEQARLQAEKKLKKHVLLREIAAREKLEVTPEEFNQELKEFSESRNIPLEQVKNYVAQDGRDEDWKLSLLLKKTVDFLQARVIIK